MTDLCFGWPLHLIIGEKEAERDHVKNGHGFPVAAQCVPYGFEEDVIPEGQEEKTGRQQFVGNLRKEKG